MIPPAQHSFIPHPPSTTCCASTRPVQSLYFLLALPLPCHIPSEYKYTHTSQPESFFLHLPRKMEPIEGSKTSAFKPQTPGKYPKENILQHQSSLIDGEPSHEMFFMTHRTTHVQTLTQLLSIHHQDDNYQLNQNNTEPGLCNRYND